MKKSVRIIIGLSIFAILLVGMVYLYYNKPQEKVWLICLVREVTGYYCPGCGAGRACYSLLHGQLYQAFRYNPLLIILLPWLGLYIAACLVQWMLTGEENISRRIPVWIPYVVLAILLIYGIHVLGAFPVASIILCAFKRSNNRKRAGSSRFVNNIYFPL